MEGKVCIVTGASSGIGKATTEGLVEMGAHVLMVCRNRERGEAAKTEIMGNLPSGLQVDSEPSQSHGIPEPKILIADLSSQVEIRNLTHKISENHPKVDVLVNNAGLITGKRMKTVDGIEWTLAVNHIAPFLLTNLLFPCLNAAPSARIITVSSEAHRWSVFNLTNLQAERFFLGFHTYGLTKLCNILFTTELARRLKGTNITANCLHPGVVRSNFGKSGSMIFRIFFNTVKPFMIGTAHGAATSLHLAISPSVDEISGAYYKRKKIAKPSAVARDSAIAKELWEESVRLTGLKKEETIGELDS